MFFGLVSILFTIVLDYGKKKLMNTGQKQGSRLTFQLASPVASDRFDPLAKRNFSLARHLLL